LKTAYRIIFERGADGLDLHTACLESKIAEDCLAFLEKEEMDGLLHLMENPYPPDSPRRWADLVAENVVMCKELDSERVREKMKRDDISTAIFEIPDEMEKSVLRSLADWNEHVLDIGDESFGCASEVKKVRLRPEERQKVHTTRYISKDTGEEYEIVLLPPERAHAEKGGE
jgi:hypothetical protein